MNSKEILSKLISINTINDKENKKIINYIESYLKSLGFKTEYKSNCLVMSNKKDCNIGFLGHTDTVNYSNNWTYNPLELTEDDGKLYGLGTSDMKGSIAAILSAVSKIDFTKTNKGIKLYFTFDEEINFKGIYELVNKKEEFPEYMLIGEPTNNETINASKGLMELKVKFKGIPSHSSTPNEGINAIENCINFINKLQKFYKKLNKEIIDNKTTTMNIGIINGGRSTNIVPDYCEVLIDFRTVSKTHNKKIIDKIKKLIENYDSDLEIINNINPFINKNEIINMSDFITEASFIEGKNKYILGVGPVNAHKKDEFITIKSLELLEKQYIDIINDKITK